MNISENKNIKIKEHYNIQDNTFSLFRIFANRFYHAEQIYNAERKVTSVSI